MPRRTSSPFAAQECDLISLKMGMRFGQYPELANGLFLRTWRAGSSLTNRQANDCLALSGDT
jgi:hypothetical protein